MADVRLLRSHRPHVVWRELRLPRHGRLRTIRAIHLGHGVGAHLHSDVEVLGPHEHPAVLYSQGLAGQRVKHIGTAMKTVQRRIKKGSEHRDFLHYILTANDDKGMSTEEINVNAFSLSGAGSESTATAMSGAIFLLLAHNPVYVRLIQEIRSAHAAEVDITLASTHQLEYLDAVITETLRMYPPVAITLPRQVPTNGEVIAGAFVPPGTTVGVHHYSTYHHPNNFYQPAAFLPERWLPGSRDAPPFANDSKDCMQPFSAGPRNCLGKNIAKAEVRLLLAKLLFRFDWRLQPGQEQWLQQKVQGFWQKKPLLCILTPVERDVR